MPSSRALNGRCITPIINRLTFNDADEIRSLFSDLIVRKVDDRLRLIPPFYTANGLEIRVGHLVFINKNCTLYDLAEISIGDDVMIGRTSVSLLQATPSQRPSGEHTWWEGPS